MLHWRYKLPMLVVTAVALASGLGKAAALGFFW